MPVRVGSGEATLRIGESYATRRVGSTLIGGVGVSIYALRDRSTGTVVYDRSTGTPVLMRQTA